MPIEPVFENLSANEKIKDVVCQVKVECKTDVPADSVERVLNDNAYSSVNIGGITDGKAEFFGRTTFFICYESEGAVKKCECGAEVKDFFLSEAIKEGDFIKVGWETERVETDLSGIKMTVSAYLTVKGEVFRKTEYSALTGGDGVYCDLKSVNTVKSYGTVVSVYSAEEEFELKYPVREVIAHRAEVCLTQVQCGVGTVICDGEIYLSEILLQSGDKNDIIRENRIIPFRAEAECEDAMPQISATCRAFIKSLKTDVSVDEEKNISTLTAFVSVDLRGEAYAIAEETVAVDAFNSENELTLSKSQATFTAESAPQSAFCKLTGTATIGDIGSARIITVASEKIEVSSASPKDNGVSVTGAVTANVLFIGEDGKIFTRKAETPFETLLAVKTDGEIKVVATPKSATVRLVTMTEAECDAEAVFTVYSESAFKTDVISAVETGEIKPETMAAVSVYIPLAGEGLWGLAKRLNVCPETLVSTNPDLQFPLTGKERIVVYRQK